MKGRNTIYISLDGIYNKLNLNTLQNPSGDYLIDKYNIILLSNLSEIVSARDSSQYDTSNAAILGNPDFEGLKRETRVDSLQERASDITSMMRYGVSNLPGTKTEIELANKSLKKADWNIVLWQGKEASEKNLKEIDTPRLLHIATHGFFSNGATSSNPLFNSGLLFSEVSKSFDFSGEDGILTAYEVVNLDLTDCDLVVLSACETGLGELENGEGVYSLQRAFQVAGVQNLIMSLWKVSDTATQELMTNFYNNWIATSDKQSAFKKAQLEFKEKYKDPYFWGAFVMVGAQ